MLARQSAAVKAVFVFAVAGSATIMGSPARASAFYLQEQSVKAVGRAFSGEVSEQGAQQMWWNPAAIGGISRPESYFGLNTIVPRANSRNVATQVGRPLTGGIVTPVGGAPNQHNPVNTGYLPTGGFAVPLSHGFAFGFTATSPFSFTSNYDADSWARYDADKTRLRVYDLQPVLAYSHGGLSIGAGPNVEYARATFANYLPDPLSPLLPDGHQYLKGDGWNVGWSAGFQFHNDLVDLGVSYKSAIKHRVKGQLIIDGFSALDPLTPLLDQNVKGAHAGFDTPWQVDFGARVHVTRKFTLNAQINRFGWDKFDQVTLSDLPAALGNQTLPQNYKNSWSYAVGTDYVVNARWTVRGGVQRDLSPISTGNRDPRVPDGDRWNFALGTTYALTQHLSVDASASYDKIKSVTIDKRETAFAGTPLALPIFTSGRLDNASALVFGIGGHMTF